MKLIEVQVMTKNSSNWKYDVKENIVIINASSIKMIRPSESVYFLRFLGDAHQNEIVIDKKSFEKIMATCQ